MRAEFYNYIGIMYANIGVMFFFFSNVCNFLGKCHSAFKIIKREFFHYFLIIHYLPSR